MGNITHADVDETRFYQALAQIPHRYLGKKMNIEQNSHRILVVDDDLEICNLLKDYLQSHFLAVTTANNGDEMFAALKTFNADLIILDVMMPGADGFQLCQELRKTSDVPVIMLTAGSDDIDRIVGLEIGADDYMAKPFNPRELLARIKAVLRRSEKATAAPENRGRLVFHEWVLDLSTRELQHQTGEHCTLNGAEFGLLTLMLQKPGYVFSRDELSNHLRGRDSYPFDRTIDVQISRLRNRLKDDGNGPLLIQTVRGSGYILATTVEKLA